jgi:hypothetical protein
MVTRALVTVVVLVMLAMHSSGARLPGIRVAREHGFRLAGGDNDGTRYRSIAGHASFFVPPTRGRSSSGT